MTDTNRSTFYRPQIVHMATAIRTSNLTLEEKRKLALVIKRMLKGKTSSGKEIDFLDLALTMEQANVAKTVQDTNYV